MQRKKVVGLLKSDETELDPEPFETEVEDQTDEQPSMALRVGNSVSFVLAILANFIFAQGQGAVAFEYIVKISPKEYAFSIWFVIYSLLGGFVYLQYFDEKFGSIVKAIGPWFIVSNFFNGLWMYTFTKNTVLTISLAALVLFAIMASNLIILQLARSFKVDNNHSI